MADSSDEWPQLLLLAMDSADWLGHDWIGTEHLVIALTRLEGSTAQRVLSRLRADAALPAKVAELLGTPPPSVVAPDAAALSERVAGRFGESALTAEPGYPPYTPRTLKVLEMAATQARQTGERPAGQHLLLALIAEGGGVAAQVLEELGLTAAIRDEVRHQMSWQALTDLVREAEDGGAGKER